MTTVYPSKEIALGAGCILVDLTVDAGRKIKPKKKKLAFVPDKTGEDAREIEVYTIKNRKGENIELGLAPYKKGFELWIIMPDGSVKKT